MTKRPTPNPSQEGNNPCHPVTRINKMKIPIQPSRGLSHEEVDAYRCHADPVSTFENH